MASKQQPALTDPGLEALAEVAACLASGLGADEVLGRISGALSRRLDGGVCRVWVRDPDGVAFHAIVPEGAPPPPLSAAGDLLRRVMEPPSAKRVNGRIEVRIPLVFEGEQLGLIEADIPEGPDADTMRRVVEIVANILAPQLASVALSEDLASEVALRTREIEAQRKFTGKIIDSLPLGLYAIDRDYRIQAWNRKRETGTQGVFREEVLGRTVFDVLYRQPRDLLKREFDRVFESGRMEQIEVESSATGESRYYRLTKIPMRLGDDQVTHVITIGEDITDWRGVQQQIAQTEKLAAVGQLAAGVMHEINNPLATIGACVEALGTRTDDLPPGDRHFVDEYLRIIDSELERCKSIVDGLLDFSRPKARAKRPADVNQIVEDALFLVKHHDRFKRIELVRDLTDGLPKIDANVEQLIQAFLALMLNAIDAMDERHGILTVRTCLNPEREDEVVIEFADTGRGIAGEDLSKIFEPFFTTKQPGRGTGLGLSICYGLVQEHGGRVTVDSHVGAGTVFNVILPVHAGSAR
jgi:two-component system NtrC family sensor kinase